MSILDDLRNMLHSVNVTDDHIRRGVRLTPRGMKKAAKLLGITENEVSDMLIALRSLEEANDLYAYEADYMGNITIRDTQAGDEHYFIGDEATSLLKRLKANPAKKDEILAPYFDRKVLNETVTKKIVDLKGTFNFPNRGRFVVVSFGTDQSGEFALEVAAVTNQNGEEIVVSDQEKTALEKIAYKWSDKV